jgi:hypothetical protein
MKENGLMTRSAKTIIHINQHNIRSNLKHGESKPVITVKRGKQNTYAHHVALVGPDGEVVAEVKYQPDHPLSCGARVWIEVPGESSLRVVTITENNKENTDAPEGD